MSVILKNHVEATAQLGVGTNLSVDSSVGDLAVIVMSGQLPGAEDPFWPSGWSGLYSANTESNRSGYIAWKTVESPSDTQDVIWFSSSTTWTARQSGSMLIFSGADSVSTLGWSTSFPTIAIDQYVFSQTHAAANVSLWKWDTTPASNIIIDGYDTVRTDASWSALRAAYVPTGANLNVWGSGQGQKPQAWLAFTLNATVEKDPISLSFTYYQNGEETPVTSLGAMPYGASSVSNLLAIKNFVVAHRGGSETWPEHSKRAYTNAVSYGVPALEISCGRTIDGVWFGCHDKSLSRVGGPSANVNTLTWDEIESAMSASAYMPARLDWLLEHYGQSHVIVFDPKYETARSAEYFDILAPYKSRVILKFSGDGNTLFKTWHDAGFTTWAYGYSDWKTGNPTAWTNLTTDPNKDILSMQWDAPKEIWDELIALGKPVTSHIPVAAAQVETAKGFGAAGTITAAPDQVLTRKV